MYIISKLSLLPWMPITTRIALACTSPLRTVVVLIGDDGAFDITTGSGMPIGEDDLSFEEEQALRVYMRQQIHLSAHLSHTEIHNAAHALQN